MKKLDTSKIIQVNFPSNQYYKEVTNKNQIVLHHTVSGKGVQGDINWWLTDPKRIATHVIISHNGQIYQNYNSKFWGHHLGIKSKVFQKYGLEPNNTGLNKQSIGIEIDRWGGLVEHKGKWHPAKWDKTNRKFIPNLRVSPIQEVTIYPDKYRGFYAFESYTLEQIESLRQLLVYWGNVFDIPLRYHHDMWEVSHNALKGMSGIWTHTSFRRDKSDCHPQKELIAMLQSLNRTILGTSPSKHS